MKRCTDNKISAATPISNKELSQELGLSTRESAKLARLEVKEGYLIEKKKSGALYYHLNLEDYSFSPDGKMWSKKGNEPRFLGKGL